MDNNQRSDYDKATQELMSILNELGFDFETQIDESFMVKCRRTGWRYNLIEILVGMPDNPRNQRVRKLVSFLNHKIHNLD